MEEDLFVADSIEVSRCENPECLLVHLTMYDEKGRERAVAVMENEGWRNVINDLQRAVYASTVLKDHDCAGNC